MKKYKLEIFLLAIFSTNLLAGMNGYILPATKSSGSGAIKKTNIASEVGKSNSSSTLAPTPKATTTPNISLNNPSNASSSDNMDYIKKSRDSAIDMLINASVKYKAGEITKEQYIAIALQCSDTANYYKKVNVTQGVDDIHQAFLHDVVSDFTSNALPAKNIQDSGFPNPPFLYGDSYNSKTGALVSHGGGICNAYPVKEFPNCQGGCGPCPASDGHPYKPSSWVYTGAGQDGGCEPGYTIFWTSSTKTGFTCDVKKSTETVASPPAEIITYKELPALNSQDSGLPNPIFLYGDSYNSKTGDLVSHGGAICSPYPIKEFPNCQGGCGPCPATETNPYKPSSWVYTGAGKDGGCQPGYKVFWTTTSKTGFTCDVAK